MRSLIDTNILLSAAFWGGNPARVIDVAQRNGNILLIPDYVIGEARSKSAELKFMRIGGLEALEDYLGGIAFEAVPDPVGDLSVDLAIRDGDDLPILRAAHTGRADVIISGDSHFHASDTSTGGVPVLRPGELVGRFG